MIDAGEDVAFCSSLNRMTGTKTDGERVELWYRSTVGNEAELRLCWRRHDEYGG